MTEGLVLPLDRAGIEAIIPHRDPFLLVDEIVELVPGEHATGHYRVRDDAWYLRGPVGRADAEASVAGELACRGTLTFALMQGEPA